MSRFQNDIELPQAGRNIEDLSQICQQVLDQELQNGLIEGRDYNIDLQRGKRPGQPDQDTAPNPLISSINQNVLSSRSFSLFHSLLNNYTRNTGVAETVTQEKEKEISDFLDDVLSGGPMRTAFNYLASKNLVATDLGRFKSQLYQMWFRLYTREVRDDTCGFEHVFVGESKDGEISGLHNWLQFYNLERSKQLDYRGYIFPKRSGGGDSTVTPNDLIVSVQFNVAGEVKDVSSIWLGTSPGFELAIYTLCFVAGKDKNVINLTSSSGTYSIEIRAYHIRSKYGDKVGSAFPVLLSKQPGSGAAPSHQPPPQQAHHPQQQQQYVPQQQQYPPPQQQQQDSANQGCGDILGQILKAIFNKLSK